MQKDSADTSKTTQPARCTANSDSTENIYYAKQYTTVSLFCLCFLLKNESAVFCLLRKQKKRVDYAE